MGYSRIVLSVLLCCAVALAAPFVPVGVLTSSGSIRVDGAEVRGSGTVFNGSVVETGSNTSQLNLKHGNRFESAAASRAQVYDDHAVLERGSSQIHASPGYSLQVNSVHITPVGPSSTIRVFRISDSKLRVVGVSGQSKVDDAGGLTIAQVVPGAAIDIQQKPEGASSTAKISGKLKKQEGHYTLVDVATTTTLELQGKSLINRWDNALQPPDRATPVWSRWFT